MENEELLEQAKAVRLKAHAPYSHYLVGACVLDDLGNAHIGCNVENAAYPNGVCAEANAIGAMISAGGSRIQTIVIVGGKENQRMQACMPCGACRQRIAEFATDKTAITVLNEAGEPANFTCTELLPHTFTLNP